MSYSLFTSSEYLFAIFRLSCLSGSVTSWSPENFSLYNWEQQDVLCTLVLFSWGSHKGDSDSPWAISVPAARRQKIELNLRNWGKGKAAWFWRVRGIFNLLISSFLSNRGRIGTSIVSLSFKSERNIIVPMKASQFNCRKVSDFKTSMHGCFSWLTYWIISCKLCI